MHPSPNQDLGPHPDFPECRVAFDESVGFFRTVPYPSEAALETFYTREYREIRQESPTYEYVNFMRHRAKAQADFILAHTGRTHFKRVIDIGCGCGELLNALQPHADELHGYETDPVMATHAQGQSVSNDIKIHNTHFVPDNSGIGCDILAMSHVLEHVPEPIDFLKKIRINSIKQSGLIFIEVPNVPDYWTEKQINWQIKGLGHINYFTPESLESIVIKSGYSIINITQCGITIYKNIKHRKPSKSIWFRFKRKVLSRLRLPLPMPSYHLQGGTNPRIYIQVIAKREK